MHRSVAEGFTRIVPAFDGSFLPRRRGNRRHCWYPWCPRLKERRYSMPNRSPGARLLLLTSLLALGACEGDEPAPEESMAPAGSATGGSTTVGSATEGSTIEIDPDDIAGIVTSDAGPEAGVWVIAETDDFDTRFARIVVTDDEGRYLVPDLPDADYRLWVRGYGLADSEKVPARPGTTIDLAATVAQDPAVAAQVYPAAYWYAMMKLPREEELADLPGGLNYYLTWIKNMGCVGCHQMGNSATRTMPEMLADIEPSHQAWARRI